MTQPAQDFVEPLCEGYFYGVHAHLLATVHSPFQRIEVLQHPLFGKLLRIDGALQCSEADEAYYHEPLVHGTLLHAQAPQRVLVIGGGDGGAAEEVLKWPQVTQVLQVELDEQVVALSRQHLQSLHGGLLEPGQQVDARYQLHIGDGLELLQQAQQAGTHWDAVVLDLTDPVGPSEQLWQPAFFQLCAQVVARGGALGLHVGAPWAQQARCAQVLAAVRLHFGYVWPLITHIPVSGGPWMMAVASHQPFAAQDRAQTWDLRLAALRPPALQAIDGRILQAMFDLAHRW